MTTMKPGDPAVRLYACDDPARPWCGKPAGSRCITADGKPTTPHPKRWNLGQGYADAHNELQPKINNLTAQNKALDTRATEAAEDLAAAQSNAASLAEQLRTARAGATLVPGLQQQVADLLAKIARLEQPAPTPVSTPAPVKVATQFGACVLDKGSTGVVAKFGHGAAIRLFAASALSWPAVPAGSLMQVSYYVASYTDAQIDALLKAAQGHLVTVHHEPDNDGMTEAQIAEWKTLNNRFYDRNVALGRPALIAPTFTGNLWSNHWTDAQRDVWLKDLKGDLFGLDFDGVHDNQTTKPADLTYRVGKTEITNADEIDAIKRALVKYAANGWQGMCVPEFGTSRRPWDTTGEGRAKWIRDNAQRFLSSGVWCPLIAWYDHAANGKSDVVDAGSPELKELQALVADNPKR